MKRVLITGATGQDGILLCRKLLADGGYLVYAMVRDPGSLSTARLLQHAADVRLVYGDLTDSTSLKACMREVDDPDFIYHLGAISSPALGWRYPDTMANVTGLGTLRLLQAAWDYCPDTSVLVACSLATHGVYGAAKTFAQMIGWDFRQRGLRVTNVVLGGHHSPLRNRHFFANKVAHGVAERWLTGSKAPLQLGDLSRRQDWGWAQDFIDQYPRILETLSPQDYVMSTGEPHSCQEWVQACCDSVGLDPGKFVQADDRFTQPTDVPELTHPPDPRLDWWKPSTEFMGLAASLVYAELEGRDVGLDRNAYLSWPRAGA